MTIEELKRKRRKNVQEQNALQRHAIASTARWWLEGNSLPLPIEELAASENITRDNALLVELGQMPACCAHTYFGCFFTREGRFWKYQIELDHSETAIDTIEEWRDVTEDIPVNAHQRGRGKSFGYLCQELMAEIIKIDPI